MVTYFLTFCLNLCRTSTSLCSQLFSYRVLCVMYFSFGCSWIFSIVEVFVICVKFFVFDPVASVHEIRRNIVLTMSNSLYSYESSFNPWSEEADFLDISEWFWRYACHLYGSLDLRLVNYMPRVFRLRFWFWSSFQLWEKLPAAQPIL